MKLNLLPTYVSKGKQAQVAIVIAILIVVGCCAATVMMMKKSKDELDTWTAKIGDAEQRANDAVAAAKEADTVIRNSAGVITNATLAKAMLDHNRVYPDFYDNLIPYIPAFYRISSLQATPVDANNASVTLTGVIQSQHQYAALMLAFNRIPGVVAVTRSGYRITEQYIPGLIETDQQGRRILRGDQHIPDDPIERLNYFVSKGSLSTYSGDGGFGNGQADTKGPMPKWSQVTVTLLMPGKLQTPNPKATLSAGGGSASSGGGAAGGRGAAPGSAPGAPPAAPGGSAGGPMGGNKAGSPGLTSAQKPG